jgi:hypothetical protein
MSEIRKLSAAASEKRFRDLRAKYEAVDRAAQEEDIRQRVKYGSYENARSWASRGDKTKLEKLHAKQSKLGDAIVDLIVKVSPRGETWKSGVPIHHLYGKLPWEDVVRPAHEPLSALPPPAWGMSEADVARQFAPVLPPGTARG